MSFIGKVKNKVFPSTQAKRVKPWFKANGDKTLMKINIEGGEYDLLEELLDENMIKQIVNLQVQFHDFVERSDERMKKSKNGCRLPIN